jgi:hypothetical protein
MLFTKPAVRGYIGTDHIDTTVARNSNDAVERTQINAHNRHVYTGSRGIVYWGRGVSNGVEKKSFV